MGDEPHYTVRQYTVNGRTYRSWDEIPEADRAALTGGPGDGAARQYTVNGRIYQSWQDVPEAERAQVMMPGVDPGPDGKVDLGDLARFALQPKVTTSSSRRGPQGFTHTARTSTPGLSIGTYYTKPSTRGGKIGLIVGIATAVAALVAALIVVAVLVLT